MSALQLPMVVVLEKSKMRTPTIYCRDRTCVIQALRVVTGAVRLPHRATGRVKHERD